MTVRATGRPVTRLEAARANAEQVLGVRGAKRVEAHGDGTLYVRAGAAAQLLAWLIDTTVCLLGFGVGFVALALVDRAVVLSDGTVAVVALSWLLVVPLLYGLCYGNGRALGAVLTGTQLVRVRDGGRIGAKACWAMLVRTLLLPVLFFVVLLPTAFTTGSFGTAGSLARISIDRAATGQLHAAGIR